MKFRSVALIVLAGIFWGTSGIFVHYLAPFGVSSVQMTAVRGLISFVPLAAFALIKNRGLFALTRRRAILCIGIGASIFGTATLYYTCMQMTSVATAVVLMYTAPIYVTVFSVTFLGERMSRLKGACMVAMLLGCCLVSGIVGGFGSDPLGLLLGVLTGIVYAVYNILTKLAMKDGAEPVSVTMYSFLVMGLVATVSCDPMGLVTTVSVAPRILPLIVAMGIVTCVLPYFCYTLSMKHLSAGTASALGIVEPMAATLFSVIWLKEQIDVFKIVGIALILLAVAFLGKEESLTDAPGDTSEECVCKQSLCDSSTAGGNDPSATR